MKILNSIMHWNQIMHLYKVAFDFMIRSEKRICCKYLASILVAYRQQLQTTPNSTIDWLYLSFLSCWRSHCWYQNAFSVSDALNGGIVFVAIAIQRGWALLSFFYWMSRFCPEQNKKSDLESSNSYTPQVFMQACANFSCDNRPSD